MSDMEALKANIAKGKVNPDKLSTEWVYQRAWNDALEWVEQQIGKIEKANT